MVMVGMSEKNAGELQCMSLKGVEQWSKICLGIYHPARLSFPIDHEINEIAKGPNLKLRNRLANADWKGSAHTAQFVLNEAIRQLTRDFTIEPTMIAPKKQTATAWNG
jgi:hypothetical protein